MIDLLPIDHDGSVWVFGYGSLMWNPGFAPATIERARLDGYQRRFCIYSVHHRGSAARPGLVLGLDRGGTCDGLAMRIAPADIRDTLAYLRRREQINGVYREQSIALDILAPSGNRRISAIAFMAERAHPSYAGRLALRCQAEIIRSATGRSGPNLDYLFATLEQLAQLGIRDDALRRLLALVGPHFSRVPTEVTRYDGSGGLHAKPCLRPSGLRLACQRFPVLAPRMRPDQRRRFTYRTSIAVWRSLVP